MQKFKAGLFGVAGVTPGVLILRPLGRWRTPAADDEEPAADVTGSEARTAADHAVAASSHARTAGEKTVEYVENEAGETRTTASGNDTESERPAPARRLRKVANGWIRR